MLTFKKFLEGKVIAHVSGASGSGKTTLATELASVHCDILFKDLDEFDDEAVKKLNWWDLNKNDFTDEMLLTLANLRQKLMNDFIENSNKPILFVGHNTEGKHVLDIPTNNKFLLNVDAKTSAYRAYLRSQKEEPRYRRTLEELPDDEKEAQEIIDWLLNNNYKPMSHQEIRRWLKSNENISTHS